MDTPQVPAHAAHAHVDAGGAQHARTDSPVPVEAHTLDALVFANAAAHPERTAVIDGTTRIDYAQLIAHASAVAETLDARGVAPGSLVGVCMHRSWSLVAALLGVLRAGCAYVPLDPAYPGARVRYMLEYSRAAAAIFDDDATAALCSDAAIGIRFDEVKPSGALHQARSSASGLAYVIYTSGSTGRPKGVAVEHRSVVAMTRAMRSLLDDDELAGVFAGASVCFDTSVMEIFGTLSLGGTVVLGQNALDLPKLPAADEITTCVMVPSSMQALLASQTLPAGIRCVVFGGEALKRPLVDRIHALTPVPRVVNAYGPTEDTVFSTACEISIGGRGVTIGRSVADSRAYILDDALRPVPAGEPGELCLAGNKLARGYLHDDALTRERFVEIEPGDALPETRLYRTGDLCRWNDEGEIEFLGRIDQQVKVRGYRIELGEIESTLERMPGVDAAAAAVAEGGIGQKVLVAYVVSRDPSVSDAGIRQFLAERLPAYMVPQVVMRLDALPYLPNDKLDRARLPDVDWSRELPQGIEDAAAQAPADGPHRQADLLARIRAELATLLGIADPDRIPS